MRTIWKFPLKITDYQWIEVPLESEILSVQSQHGQLCLWAEVDSDSSKSRWTVYVIGTGNPLPEMHGTHVGSVIMNPFVWHVYVSKGYSREEELRYVSP